MIFLRSLVFALAQILLTPPYAIVALATFPLPRLSRYRIISGWAHAMIWLAKSVLGITYRVVGMENLPQTPGVILSKHQSAWETLAFQVIFPPQVLVLKRELLWIPFFGWGLALTSPIAIDRRRGVRALNRMAELGRERLAQGSGSRSSGRNARKAGRARQVSRRRRLARSKMRCAGSAGRAQRRPGVGPQGLSQAPGTVTVEIGPPIDSRVHTPESLNLSVEGWIRAAWRSMSPALKQLHLQFDVSPRAENAGRLRQLQLAGGILGYHLVRSRRRTIALFIDGDGIEARAPRHATVAEIEAFILEKERWIRKRLAVPRRQPLVWQAGPRCRGWAGP